MNALKGLIRKEIYRKYFLIILYMKTCRDCNIELNKENKYGRNRTCKKCYNQRRKLCQSYRNKYPEKINLLNDEVKQNILELYNRSIKISVISLKVKIPYHIVYNFIKSQRDDNIFIVEV